MSNQGVVRLTAADGRTESRYWATIRLYWVPSIRDETLQDFSAPVNRPWSLPSYDAKAPHSVSQVAVCLRCYAICLDPAERDPASGSCWCPACFRPIPLHSLYRARAYTYSKARLGERTSYLVLITAILVVAAIVAWYAAKTRVPDYSGVAALSVGLSVLGLLAAAFICARAHLRVRHYYLVTALLGSWCPRCKILKRSHSSNTISEKCPSCNLNRVAFGCRQCNEVFDIKDNSMACPTCSTLARHGAPPHGDLII